MSRLETLALQMRTMAGELEAMEGGPVPEPEPVPEPDPTAMVVVCGLFITVMGFLVGWVLSVVFGG